MPEMPWDGLIPQEDLGAFAAGFASGEDRPIAVGERPALLVVDMTRAFVDSAYPKGWGETGWPAVAQTARLLAAARAAGRRALLDRRRQSARGGGRRSCP